MRVLNSDDALLAIRRYMNLRFTVYFNETLKRVSSISRLREIPRWIAEAEKDEGPLHPDTFLSCRSYVNPRCFFAALLIIDHLITIHYTLPTPFLLQRTVGRHYSCTEKSSIGTDRDKEREGEREREAAGERGKLFLPAAPGDGRPFAYRPPYRQTHRGRPS